MLKSLWNTGANLIKTVEVLTEIPKAYAEKAVEKAKEPLEKKESDPKDKEEGR